MDDGLDYDYDSGTTSKYCIVSLTDWQSSSF